jgi:hypothetical protein
MLSVQPQWLAKILNGEKTIEIRKSAPKEFPCEVYLYCTKKENTALVIPKGETNYGQVVDKTMFVKMPEAYWKLPLGYHGLVVAKFKLNKVVRYDWDGYAMDEDEHASVFADEIFKKSKMGNIELANYGNGKPLYAWHIDNLVIFEKPMELKDFATWNETKWSDEATHWIPLTKAPQSWQYVEVIE